MQPSAELEDEILRRESPATRHRFAAPMPMVGSLAAENVALSTVDRREEVNGVGVVDGGFVDDLNRVTKRRKVWIFVKGALDCAVNVPHQVAIPLCEIAIGGRRGHQLGLVDRVSGAFQLGDQVVPGSA